MRYVFSYLKSLSMLRNQVVVAVFGALSCIDWSEAFLRFSVCPVVCYCDFAPGTAAFQGVRGKAFHRYLLSEFLLISME